MSVLLNILGILALAVLIFISIGLHEFGHFITAKRFGVKVTEFMIGFGPKIFSRKKGETSYGFKLFPLGGYVRILGMYPPAKEGSQQAGAVRSVNQSAEGDTIVAEADSAVSTQARRPGRFAHLVDQARAESMKGLDPGEEDRAFYRLPVGKRVVVMLAGPFTNLVLAFVFIAIVLVGIGIPTPSLTIDRVIDCVPTAANPNGSTTDGRCEGSPPTAAFSSDIAAGDRITAVNGAPVEDWEQVTTALRNTDEPTAITLSTATGERTVVAEPVSYPRVDEAGQPVLDENGQQVTDTRAFLGVNPEQYLQRQAPQQVPVFIWDATTRSVTALFALPAKMYDLGVTLATNGERDVEGPVSVVGISRIGGEVVADDQLEWANKVGFIFTLAATLNLFLFLFNLLPIPPLDGGHVAAALWEAIRRKWAAWRGRPDPGVVDTAKLLPVTYVVAVILIGVGVMVIWADLFKPISLT